MAERSRESLKRVAVLGGGIAGLTVAHELLKRDYTVDVFEKLSVVGGMARSRREPNGVPSEVSWRAIGPFYNNFVNILEQIPTGRDTTVLDNLSERWCAYLFSDDGSWWKNLEFDRKDLALLTYHTARVMLSNRRRAEYNALKLTEVLQRRPHLSDKGRKQILRYSVGPGFGMDEYSASYAKFFEVIGYYMLHDSIPPKFRDHNDWRLFTKPSSEALFDPWLAQLKTFPGFTLHTECVLEQLQTEEGRISGCRVRTPQGEQLIRADEYALCLNPFEAEKVLSESQLGELARMHQAINEKSAHNQISFQLAFKKKLHFPELVTLNFIDSEFNLSIVPWDQYWQKEVPIDHSGELRSLWSGTICDSSMVAPGLDRSASQMSHEQLYTQICHQILRCSSFQKLFHEANGFYLRETDIDYHEIWYEWIFENGEQRQSNLKWVNNHCNSNHLFDQKTDMPNLYLGGAHTRTSLNVWSMEAAVDSGKRVANLILEKYRSPPCDLYVRSVPAWMKALRWADDVALRMRAGA